MKVFKWLWKRKLFVLLSLVVILAGIVFASYKMIHYTSDPAFCQRCHPNEKPGPLGEVYTWKKSKHAMAGVQCLDCHAAPGFMNYMKAKMGGLYDTYSELVNGKEHKMHILMHSADPEYAKKYSGDARYAAKLVSIETCMFCHTDEENQRIRNSRLMTVITPLRFQDSVVNPEFRLKRGLPAILKGELRPETRVNPNHKLHYDAGYSCVDCHLHITHSGVTGYRTNMPLCHKCHDEVRTKYKKVPANDNCLACHRNKDQIAPTQPIIFAAKLKPGVAYNHKTHLPIAQCTDCHSKLFPTKKGSTTIKWADHNANLYCHSCHDGKKKFNGKLASLDCALCHGKTIPIPTPIVYYKLTDTSPVQFSHITHTKDEPCVTCHTKIWPMKQGASKMTMALMFEGQFCAVCHDGKTHKGKTVFDTNGECTTCHKDL